MVQHAAAPEFEIPEHHRTNTGQTHRKVLMWTFLGSDCMFFGALIGTFLVYQNNPGAGPPREEVLSSVYLVSLMAFILLVSSFTMVLALAAARRGDQKMMSVWLLTTAFLGLFFIASQGYEFWSFINHNHLTPRTNLFGASFMLLTGFHGSHVSAGILWLVAVVFLVRLDPKAPPVNTTLLPKFLRFLSGLPARSPDERVEVRPRQRRYTALTQGVAQVAPAVVQDPEVQAMQEYEEERLREERVLNVELAGLYWHFVDVVWVVIFTVIYLFTPSLPEV